MFPEDSIAPTVRRREEPARFVRSDSGAIVRCLLFINLLSAVLMIAMLLRQSDRMEQQTERIAALKTEIAAMESRAGEKLAGLTPEVDLRVARLEAQTAQVRAEIAEAEARAERRFPQLLDKYIRSRLWNAKF